MSSRDGNASHTLPRAGFSAERGYVHRGEVSSVRHATAASPGLTFVETSNLIQTFWPISYRFLCFPLLD